MGYELELDEDSRLKQDNPIKEKDLEIKMRNLKSNPMEMKNKTICEKEVELLNEKYLVYLKKVATKIAPGGVVECTAVRAFVRKV